MAVTVKDDSITRSVMFLCLGAAALLLVIQWRMGASGSAVQLARAQVAETPRSRFKQSSAKRQQPTATPKPTAPASSQLLSTQLPPKPTTQSAATSTTAPAANLNLVVDLSDRRVYVFQNGKQSTSYPLAVGQAGWETPTGKFQVLEMQTDPEWMHPITKEVIPPGPDNPLGKRWIGFWIDGETHLGFHGTNQEELIGEAVSHGCLRMRNRDVIALYDKVSEGTPVVVRH